MAGGRRVDDHRLVAAGLGHAPELQEPTQLVDAGEGEIEEPIDVPLVEIRATLGDEPQGAAPRAEPAGEGLLGVELEGVERRAGSRDPRHPRAQPAAERVTQRVRGIGRHDERAPPGAGGREGEGGGSGRLADPTLAADELVAWRPAPGARPAHRPRAPGSGPSSSASSPRTLASTPVTLNAAGRLRAALLPRPDFPDAGQEILLGLGELRLGDLAELQAHLGGQELLPPHRVVGQLGVHRGRDLPEHELEASDEEGVEDDHSDSRARSSFRRMLTKLYGGHGPV